MRLYLMQHGEAMPKAEDPDRPLSERGRSDVAAIAATLAGAGVTAARIVHSGKTRARQSAEILAGAVPGTAPESSPGLAPNDPVEPVAARSWGGDTILVGHLPFMARLAAALLGGDPEHPPVAFVPGTMLALEQADGQWAVSWMLRPALVTRHGPEAK